MTATWYRLVCASCRRGAVVCRADVIILTSDWCVVAGQVAAPVLSALVTIITLGILLTASGDGGKDATTGRLAGIGSTRIGIETGNFLVMAEVIIATLGSTGITVVAVPCHKAAIINGQKDAAHVRVAGVGRTRIVVVAKVEILILTGSVETCPSCTDVAVVAINIADAAVGDFRELASGQGIASIDGTGVIVVAGDRLVATREVGADICGALIAIATLNVGCAAQRDWSVCASGLWRTGVCGAGIAVITADESPGAAGPLITFIPFGASIAIVAVGRNVKVIADADIRVTEVCGAGVVVLAVDGRTDTDPGGALIVHGAGIVIVTSRPIRSGNFNAADFWFTETNDTGRSGLTL
jgi:hypothetical protein